MDTQRWWGFEGVSTAKLNRVSYCSFSRRDVMIIFKKDLFQILAHALTRWIIHTHYVYGVLYTQFKIIIQLMIKIKPLSWFHKSEKCPPTIHENSTLHFHRIYSGQNMTCGRTLSGPLGLLVLPGPGTISLWCILPSPGHAVGLGQPCSWLAFLDSLGSGGSWLPLPLAPALQ